LLSDVIQNVPLEVLQSVPSSKSQFGTSDPEHLMWSFDQQYDPVLVVVI